MRLIVKARADLLPKPGGRRNWWDWEKVARQERPVRRITIDQQTHLHFEFWELRAIRSEVSRSWVVSMMQTAEPRHGDDFAGPLAFCCLTTTRSLLAQAQMRPVVVVITDELIHEPFQMPFIHNDHVVEQIPAAGANPTFCDTILPRTSETGSLWCNAKGLHGVDDFIVEVRTAIENQVLRG